MEIRQIIGYSHFMMYNEFCHHFCHRCLFPKIYIHIYIYIYIYIWPPWDVRLTLSRNHKVFFLSSTYNMLLQKQLCQRCFEMRNPAISRRIITCMTLPAEQADVICQVKLWSPKAEGLTLSSISQGLHLAHRKPEYGYGFIDKENRIKVTHILVDWCRYFALFGDSYRVRACAPIFQMNG